MVGGQSNGNYLGQVNTKAITREIEDSYIDYAMSVIVSRALPDARDGLKPVQRRILYAMHSDLSLRPGSAHKKSARIVGEVLGKYHPHGDLAVYAAMARMVQDFSLRYPLVDGQGNFGSIDGDNPAAMRYTEARLSRLAAPMLDDIEKNTVDWQLNFDDSLEEPRVLPTLVPNLLVNGTSGIAVGMATNIPPHNLGETVDALRFLLDNWERRQMVPVDELMRLVKGPDFPMGGQILGTQGIRDAFTFGHGRIVVRAPGTIEEMRGGNRHRLVFTAIPFMVNKSELIGRIADLVREGVRLRDISDMRDESDRNGLRLVIELKSGAVPERVLNQLYKHSDLQIAFSVNVRALVDSKPVRLNLRQALLCHLDHRIEVVTRRTEYLLAAVRERAHILAGLLLAIQDIDRVIAIIRGSESADAAADTLTSAFNFTRRQVRAILDMALRRLAGLEQQRLDDEYQETQTQIAYYQALLDDPAKLRELIKSELGELKERFNDPRRTEILLGVHPELSDEDLVTKQDDLISFWQSSNIRRTIASDFTVQGRGGKGVTSRSDRETTAVTRLLYANSLDTLLFISNKGRMYASKVYNLPVGSRTSRGATVRGSISMSLADELPDAFVRIPTSSSDSHLILFTRRGRVKRMMLSSFRKLKTNGKRGITLLPGDAVVQGVTTDGTRDLLVVTRRGKALRFRESTLRCQGTTGTGVRGIRLAADDEVVGCLPVTDRDTVLVVYGFGQGKRVKMAGWLAKGRNTQGRWITNHRMRERIGDVTAISVVRDEDEIALVSDNGMMVRTPCADLPVLSSSAVGSRIMGLAEGDQVAGVAALPPGLDMAPPSHDDERDGEPAAEPAEAPGG